MPDVDDRCPERHNAQYRFVPYSMDQTGLSCNFDFICRGDNSCFRSAGRVVSQFRERYAGIERGIDRFHGGDRGRASHGYPMDHELPGGCHWGDCGRRSKGRVVCQRCWVHYLSHGRHKRQRHSQRSRRYSDIHDLGGQCQHQRANHYEWRGGVRRGWGWNSFIRHRRDDYGHPTNARHAE